jgi:hypothetical protein
MDYYLIEKLAEAVADDTNLLLPRRWLAKHNIESYEFVGLTPKDRSPYEILLQDYKEMKLAAQLMIDKPHRSGRADAFEMNELYNGTIEL